MGNIIVNADDFGLCNGVNYGIVDSHKFGVVTSTTMLVNMPGTEHAVELAKQYPSLNLGIHLTLTCGKPVHNEVPSLVNEEGYFRLTSRFHNESTINLNEVEIEWDAQIQKFLSFNLPLSHIDSHHHIHGWELLTPVIQKLSKKYDLCVRNVFDKKISGLSYFTERFTMDFYGEKVSKEFFSELNKKIDDEETIEVMCHPAYIDSYLKKHSSYCEERLVELDVLTSVTI
ncbi:chitin disaccharide deacetylase [Rossellomorea sp. BNER]|uniref:chitin disaccharide deacetylase n=1 Tax=Rossellomorea sp. BNER TaxID=2962031 RepID=UPI003AF266A4|nr:chitin disaccharide deacetylase [Rossellomorea sp. BNER]